MEIDFTNLPLEDLKRIKELAEAELKTSLLDGAEWNVVQQKNAVITRLAILIHHKNRDSGSSPADHPTRNS
jgi:hypothetical protein